MKFLNCLMLLLLSVGAFPLVAQNSIPKWVNQLPKPGNETYYYRVTHAEEETYEKAYVRAFSMVILESSWKMGLPVDSQNDMATIEHGVENNISVRSHQSNIAINKVCEYEEKNYVSNKIRLYILWQVASVGGTMPLFDDFRDCR